MFRFPVVRVFQGLHVGFPMLWNSEETSQDSNWANCDPFGMSWTLHSYLIIFAWTKNKWLHRLYKFPDISCKHVTSNSIFRHIMTFFSCIFKEYTTLYFTGTCTRNCLWVFPNLTIGLKPSLLLLLSPPPRPADLHSASFLFYILQQRKQQPCRALDLKAGVSRHIGHHRLAYQK